MALHIFTCGKCGRRFIGWSMGRAYEKLRAHRSKHMTPDRAIGGQS